MDLKKKTRLIFEVSLVSKKLSTISWLFFLRTTDAYATTLLYWMNEFHNVFYDLNVKTHFLVDHYFQLFIEFSSQSKNGLHSIGFG